MSLCLSCRDKLISPGYFLLFTPADLDFFIDFELRDRARRLSLSSPHDDPARRSRRVPTASEYAAHCVSQGYEPVSSVANGGAYRVILLHEAGRHYFPRDGQDLEAVKTWHGAPMAAMVCALRAGFRRWWIENVPRNVKGKLETLGRLYRGGVG